MSEETYTRFGKEQAARRPIVIESPESYERATGHRLAPHEAERFFGPTPLTIIPLCDVLAPSVLAPAAVIDTRAIDPSLYRVEASHYDPEPWEDEE